jgi:hypothetical protein
MLALRQTKPICKSRQQPCLFFRHCQTAQLLRNAPIPEFKVSSEPALKEISRFSRLFPNPPNFFGFFPERSSPPCTPSYPASPTPTCYFLTFQTVPSRPNSFQRPTTTPADHKIERKIPPTLGGTDYLA